MTPLVSGFTKFASSNLSFGEGDFARLITYSVIGGTASVIGGGKFENGALTRAFQYLVNELNTEKSCFGKCVKVYDEKAKDWMWVNENVAGDAACGAAIGGNLCSTQSSTLNNGIASTAKAVQFAFPTTFIGRAINFIDSVVTYVGAVFSGSPRDAAGTLAGDLVTKRIKPYMTNNPNAERIGIATELIVNKAADENR